MTDAIARKGFVLFSSRSGLFAQELTLELTLLDTGA
jgi:hypothetical protein